MAAIFVWIVGSPIMQPALLDFSYTRPMDDQGFRLLVDSVTGCAIYMLDPDGYIVSWNKGAERIKQYTSDEIVGQHFRRFYTDEDQEHCVPENALWCARDKGRFEATGWRVRKDGSRFLADVDCQLVRNTGGDIVGFAKRRRAI